MSKTLVVSVIANKMLCFLVGNWMVTFSYPSYMSFADASLPIGIRDIRCSSKSMHNGIDDCCL